MSGYAGRSVGLLLALLPVSRGLAAAVSGAKTASAQPAAPLREPRYKVVVNALCEQPWIVRGHISAIGYVSGETPAVGVRVLEVRP